MSGNESRTPARPVRLSSRSALAVAAACLVAAMPLGATLQASPDDAERPKSPENSNAKQTGNATPKAERRICRNIESTGSRLETQRVCLTAREWRQVDR